MCGDRPHPVPRRVVEALIEVTDARGILQLGSKLRSGGAVRLMAGPQGASRSFFIFSAGKSQFQRSARASAKGKVCMHATAHSPRAWSVVPALA